jgi:hypothetical protein
VDSHLKYFLLGVGGAFSAYFALYRESRFRDFFTDPRQYWNTFVFDLVFFLFCGGLIATFLVDPQNAKEAFMAGISWQGLVGGVLAGNELKTVNEAKAVRRAQTRKPKP